MPKIECLGGKLDGKKVKFVHHRFDVPVMVPNEDGTFRFDQQRYELMRLNDGREFMVWDGLLEQEVFAIIGD